MNTFRVVLYLLIFVFTKTSASKNVQEEVRQRLDAMAREILQGIEEKKITALNSFGRSTEYMNRDELQVNKIWVDQSIQFPANITKWETIPTARNVTVAGFQKNVITIITWNSDGNLLNNMSFDVSGTISSLKIIKRWNRNLRIMELVLIVAEKNIPNVIAQLSWYRVAEKNLEKIWSWRLGNVVEQIENFEIDDHKFLALKSEEDKNQTSVDIYEYIFTNDISDKWLIQHLSLLNGQIDIVISTSFENTLISISNSATEELTVYKFKEYLFIPFDKQKIPNLKNIIGFNLGFKSYIATIGLDLTIFRIGRRSLIREHILNRNFGFVTYVLPVKISIFRDDIILFVKHEINHGLHSSTDMEIIYYHNGNFTIHDDINCEYSGEIGTTLSCLVGEDTDFDLKGSVGLTFRNGSKVLLNKGGLFSELFVLNCSFVPVPNPVHEEMRYMMERRNVIKKMLSQQQELSESIRNRSNTTNQNTIADDFPKIIEDSLPQPSIVNSETILPPPQDIKINNPALNNLKELIDDIKFDINEIKETLNNAIPLKSPHLQFLGEINMRGKVSVRGDVIIDHLEAGIINSESPSVILNNTVSLNDKRIINGEKIFHNISVEHMNVNNLNNITVSEIAYKSETPLHINGNIVFKRPVHVENITLNNGGLINNIKPNHIFQVDKFFDGDLKIPIVNTSGDVHIQFLNNKTITNNNKISNSVSIDNVKIKNLEISENIFTKEINGINFDHLIGNIFDTTIETRIEKPIKIKNIINNGNASIRTLNNLDFNEEYVFKSNRRFIRVTGKKIFASSLSAVEISANGTLDGLEPSDLFSLGTNQVLPGKYTFHDLEVTESLNIEDSLYSKNVSFIKNPTLKEVLEVNSDVFFTNLIVEGDVIVAEDINNTNWKDLMENVVYKTDEEEPLITSTKIFKNDVLLFNEGLSISSNLLNGINISKFITTNTNQTIDQDFLNIYATFLNLHVEGLFDEIDINDFNENVIKLNKNQTVFSDIIFNNEDLITEELNIVKSLNNKDFNGYLNHEDKFITGEDGKVLVDGLITDVLIVQGDLISPELESYLREFDKIRLSVSNLQDIDGHFEIGNMSVQSLDADFINGVPISDLINFTSIRTRLDDFTLKNNIIKELHIDGEITCNLLNGGNFSELLENVIWINRENRLNNVHFMDASFEDLNIKNWNGENFQQLISDIVLKTESSITVSGQKRFLSGFDASGNITSKKLNDVFIDDFLNTFGSQFISGPLVINADVVVEHDLNVNGDLNNFSWSNVNNIFKKQGDGTYFINGEVIFNGAAKIDNLVIKNFINDENLELFLNNLIYKNFTGKFIGTPIFKNKVIFNENLAVFNNYNNINLGGFLNDIILLNKDAVIDGSVLFGNGVDIKSNIYVKSNMNTGYLLGKSMDELKHNSVPLDGSKFIKGKLFFNDTIIDDDIEIDFLNGIDMEKLISLDEDQIIDSDLSFAKLSTIQDHILVGNLVNGVNLTEEYENTVLIAANVTIITPTIFKDEIYTVGINTMGPVNNKDLNKMVTTYKDHELNALYEFHDKVDFVDKANLIVDGHILDINLEKWFEKRVTLSGKNQLITGDWEVRGNVIFEDDVHGNGSINSFDLNSLLKRKEHTISINKEYEQNYKRNYQIYCQNVSNLKYAAENQMYFFKYLEKSQDIHEEKNIYNIHIFNSNTFNYLLISYFGVCDSSIYEWFPYERQFKKIFTINISPVDQWITIKNRGSSYFVTRSSRDITCEFEGVNMWRIESTQVQHVKKLNDANYLQESAKDGVYYALDDTTVIEYNIEDNNLRLRGSGIEEKRKWIVGKGNMKFLPPTLGLGLSLTNGQEIKKLSRKQLSSNTTLMRSNENGYLYHNVSTMFNPYLPVDDSAETIILNVGYESSRRSLLATAVHERTSVKGRLDFIKIYEDIKNGKLFHKVQTYKPSSLNSVEIEETGETLLIFLEDKKLIQVYEYKGIIGFKYHSSIKFSGSKLIKAVLPTDKKPKQNYLILMNKNKLTLIEVVMSGTRLKMDQINCNL